MASMSSKAIKAFFSPRCSACQNYFCSPKYRETTPAGSEAPRVEKLHTVALAGNPNSGKTAVFNCLTGRHQRVGNYPGVTVERIEGTYRHGGHTFRVLDLPGIYGLAARSVEARIARDVLLREDPDIVVCVIDASNLERNLYLATQILELQRPLILVFNMSDIAASLGLEFDLVEAARQLGAPVVPTVAHCGRGIGELQDVITSLIGDSRDDLAGLSCDSRDDLAGLPATACDGAASQSTAGRAPCIEYGQEAEREIARLTARVAAHTPTLPGPDTRWTAVKLLEEDDLVLQAASAELRTTAADSITHLEKTLGDLPSVCFAEKRYAFITAACERFRREPPLRDLTASDRADRILLNRYLGLPIFAALMFLVFQLVFTLGGPVMAGLESALGWTSEAVSGLWPAGSDSLARSLLVDGVIAGVGTVLIFLPNIFLLFLAIAILEDSGYMSRAAFLMDRVMRWIGLQGRSFIPLLTGFGCTVPAIMATRTLEDERDRLTTMMIAPLMSCGARLPIYALIIPAFFTPRLHGLVLTSLYLLGIALAFVIARLLRSSVFRGAAPPMVMELPPYRVPSARTITLQTWTRGRAYLQKAGGLIFVLSILLWAATSFPRGESRSDTSSDLINEPISNAIRNASPPLAESIAGRIGIALEPVLEPAGLDWRMGTALVGAFAAKEVLVAQLGIVYALGEDASPASLRRHLADEYSPVTAFGLMLFCLVGLPCMATVAIMKKESNSWTWALLQFAGLTLIGYLLAVLVHQGGLLLGLHG